MPLEQVLNSTPGLSDEARYVDDATREENRRFRTSIMFGLSSVVFEELAQVAEDCREPNWDGFEAVPVEQDTFRNAFFFLEALPVGTEAPSIGAEPDGHLTLEWHRSPRRTLSVSVSPEGDLHYSALIGPNTQHGSEVFCGEVPKSILDLISRVTSV